MMIALRILSAVRGLFTADSLALGAHWVYDQNVLREQVGDRLHYGLLAPIAKWHEGKSAGDFTMYGDQCLWLLEHLAKQDGAYDEGNWTAYWREHMAVYTGYVDGASKTTLSGTPSDSHDFSAVGRVTPLLAVANTEDQLVTAAKSAVRITHNNPKVIAAAELVGRVAFRLAAVPEGQAAPSVVALLTEVADKLNDAFISTAVAQGLAAAKDGNLTENAAISGMGAGCSIEGSLPSTVFLLARHEAAGKGAAGVEAIMVANCLAGGDSAARGMVIGTLLGLAYPTESASSPQKWYGAVKTRERIEAALGALGK